MHCPRCGAHHEEGDQYCAACGAALPAARSEPRQALSPRERLAGLVGGTPRARLLTAGTALALALAVVAFVALKPEGGEEGPRHDPYTLAADATCVRGKQLIAAAEQRSLSRGYHSDRGEYAGAVVRIVAQWRAALAELSPPADRAAQAQSLGAALANVEVKAGTLARIERESSNGSTALAYAQKVDDATAEVEQAISALGLERCAAIRLGEQANGQG
jgi:zinc-ribbon domain